VRPTTKDSLDAIPGGEGQAGWGGPSGQTSIGQAGHIGIDRNATEQGKDRSANFDAHPAEPLTRTGDKK